MKIGCSRLGERVKKFGKKSGTDKDLIERLDRHIV